MTGLALMVLSAALAAAGLVAGWLGFDDRNPAWFSAAAMAIGSAAIVFALTLLAREARKMRIALVGALADSVPPRAQPPVIVPAVDQAGGALAAVEAELAAPPSAPAPAEPVPAPVEPAAAPSVIPLSPSRPRSADWLRRPGNGASDAPASRLLAPVPAPEPAQAAPLAVPPAPAALLAGVARAAPAAGFGSRSREDSDHGPRHLAPAALPDEAGAPAEEPAAAAAPVEPAPAWSPPKPPDIDTILNEIISRRDRPAPLPGQWRGLRLAPGGTAETAEPREQAPDQGNDATVAGAPPPAVETERDLAPPPAVWIVDPQVAARADEPADNSDRDPEQSRLGSPADEDPALPAEVSQASSEAPAIEPEPVQTAGLDMEPIAAEPEPAAETRHDVAESQTESPPEEGPPAPQTFHEVGAGDAAPEDTHAHEASRKKLVRSFSSGPNRYTMFDDGSIEAETPNGRLEFKSFDELRRYIDERMTSRATGT